MCSNMDRPRDYHTKWSPTKISIQISLICEILKNGVNKLIYKTETYSQTSKTNLWLPAGKACGEGKIRSLGLTYTHYYV